jgi:antitoxin (DNA-binding transcriptional repressor) of toxin-antitoxin stability system
MVEILGVAEAKRRFSELIDRVGAGERLMPPVTGRPQWREPPLGPLRQLAQIPASERAITTITRGELLYGAARRGTSSWCGASGRR